MSNYCLGMRKQNNGYSLTLIFSSEHKKYTNEITEKNEFEVNSSVNHGGGQVMS